MHMHGIDCTLVLKPVQGVGDHTSTAWVNRDFTGDLGGNAVDANAIDFVKTGVHTGVARSGRQNRHVVACRPLLQGEGAQLHLNPA